MNLAFKPRVKTDRRSLKNASSQLHSFNNQNSLPFLNSYSHYSSPKLTHSSSLSALEIFHLYRAKCKDLKILHSADQEKMFISNFFSSFNEKILNLKANGLGRYSAEIISNFIQNSKQYSQVILSNNILSDEGCYLIGKALRDNLSIIHLDISGNNLTPEGSFRFLNEITNNKSLVSLDMSSLDLMNKNRLGLKGIEALSNLIYNTNTLMILNIAGTGVGQEGLDILALGLSYNSSLLSLNLSDNYIQGKNMALFFSVLGRTSMIELILSNNHVKQKGSELLYNFVISSQDSPCLLRKLDVSRCQIDDDSAERFYLGLEKNSSVTELNFSLNPTSPKFGNCLSKFLFYNSSVVYLNLSQCNLKEEGIFNMIEGLSCNSAVKHLNLSNNYICNDGMKALSEVIERNSTLVSVDLSGNLIKNSGCLEFIESLYKNNHITSVNLNNNSLKDPIGHDILALVSRRKNLLVFSIDLNTINLKYVCLIRKCLAKNNLKLKKNLYPKIQNEIKKLVIKDEDIKTVFGQLSLTEKEKEEVNKKFVKKRTKLFQLQDEETEKFEMIVEERNRILERKQTLTRDHDLTFYDISKVKYIKEKETREIKDMIGSVLYEIGLLNTKSKVYLESMIADVVKQKKQKFGIIVGELKGNLQKVEGERNKLRNELEEMKVNFKNLCNQLISMKNALKSSREDMEQNDILRSPKSRKKTIISIKTKKFYKA